MNDKAVLTIPEAARLLGFSRGFGYELARRGEIPVIRFGRRLVVPKAAFERMIGLNSEGGEK
ncbi:helix-turn-helix domain-containing protein [Chloroflexota bacterium]